MTCDEVDRPRLAELVGLTTGLGLPEHEFVTLAEGNTSTLLNSGDLLIKASGAQMGAITDEDFVQVPLEPLTKLLRARHGSAAQNRSAVTGRTPGGAIRAGSIETLLHAVCVLAGQASWVAHTHPTPLVGLLSSADPRSHFRGPLFPDEAVVTGLDPLYVGYAEPGLALAVAIQDALTERIERDGQIPRLVLLENHGIVALGSSSAEVHAITAMATKAARVRLAAAAAGGARPLAREALQRMLARDDEQSRRAVFTGPRT